MIIKPDEWLCQSLSKHKKKLFPVMEMGFPKLISI